MDGYDINEEVIKYIANNIKSFKQAAAELEKLGVN